MLLKILRIMFFAVFCLILFILIFYTVKYFKNRDKLDALSMQRDTTILYRYRQELKRDTVVKWYEKIRYTKNKPSKIGIQKADSLSKSELMDKNLIFKINKDDEHLIIKALDVNGDLIKEYDFKDIGRDFSISSQKDNIFVKSKNLYFNGLDIYAGYCADNELNGQVILGISTGLNWRDRFYISGKAEFITGEKIFSGGINLGIKLFH